METIYSWESKALSLIRKSLTIDKLYSNQYIDEPAPHSHIKKTWNNSICIYHHLNNFLKNGNLTLSSIYVNKFKNH